MSDTQTLGGNVNTQFTYLDPSEFAPSVEAARVEQEAMCGYPLMLIGTRVGPWTDPKTQRHGFEIFATFGPAPVFEAPPAPPMPVDGTQVG